MDETKGKLEESLVDILAWLKETAASGTDFVSEQAPIVCQEIVAFGRIWWTLLLILCLIAVATSVFLFRYANQKEAEANEIEDKHEAGWCRKQKNLMAESVAAGFLFIALFLGGAVGIFACGYWCLLVWFAPRLYIIDYLKDLF